jgi:hypothetical protein
VKAQNLSRKLRNWIGSGVFQSEDGAFCAWQEEDTGKLAFEYPEINGYALTYLAGRADPTPEEKLAGLSAGKWLLRRFAANDFSARSGWDTGVAYNFDLGIIANGLMLFGSRFDVPSFVEQGFKLVEYLRKELSPEGRLHPLSSEHSISTDRPVSWSTAGYAHMLKPVQSFLLAARLGLDGAMEAATRLYEFSKQWQLDNGRFLTQPQEDFTMLHPHFYTVEGFWMWSVCQNDSEALERAKAGLEWAWPYQLETGGFPRQVVINGANSSAIEQFDTTSQALRMALLINPQLPGIAKAIERLEQTVRGDEEKGALLYQPTSGNLHLNSWVTMFAAQAVGLAAPGATAFSWEEMV